MAKVEVALLNTGLGTCWIVNVDGVEVKRFSGTQLGWEQANEEADAIEAEGE